MAKKSGKSVSFDAMIKFFMIRFEIPTRQDIQKILNRLDQLEKTINKNAICAKPRRSAGANGGGNTRTTGQALNASDVILKAIKGSAKGLDYAGISEITHFDEKKIRNILHRLFKTGKIQRKRRGLYVAG